MIKKGGAMIFIRWHSKNYIDISPTGVCFFSLELWLIKILILRMVSEEQNLKNDFSESGPLIQLNLDVKAHSQ